MTVVLCGGKIKEPTKKSVTRVGFEPTPEDNGS